MDCVHFISPFHHFCDICVTGYSDPAASYIKNAAGIDRRVRSIILMTVDNDRGHCGSPEIQSCQPNLQKKWKLENVYNKTN